MAAVNMRKYVTENFTIKLLALAIATVLWFSVAAEKETVKEISVPLRVTNIPPGLSVANDVPGALEVSVAGPGILFLMYPVRDEPLTLDLRKTGEGTVAFPDLQRYLDIPQGMRVVRIFPSSIELKLVRIKGGMQ